LEHPAIEREAKERDLEAWQVVQRAFEKLKKHRKTPAGLNIWTCLVKGPRKSKQLRGYLLLEPTGLKGGVISHRIIIIDAKARVHTVDSTAFLVSLDIFKRYALE
ncbi:conjugal transfer nickase/helicase domain-containing protein, partial [Pseudomonas viridiflava]|uniref:conjugal transfer nickase/helicase domain-containing protein n=1 Tax=Pseudomonas viridiflava TaxID=33069 RepID=UPI001F11F581